MTEKYIDVYVPDPKKKNIFRVLHPIDSLSSARKNSKIHSKLVNLEFDETQSGIRIYLSVSFPDFFPKLIKSLLKTGNDVVIEKQEDLKADSIKIIFKQADSLLVINIIEKLEWILSVLKHEHNFASAIELSYKKGSTSSIMPHNMLEVNPQWSADNNFSENELIMVINPETQFHLECCIKTNSGVDYSGFKTTKMVKNILKIADGTNIILLKNIDIVCESAVIQSVTEINDSNITLSSNFYNRINHDFSEYQIRHLATGALYTISTGKITNNDTLSDTSIQLNYYQRLMLNLCNPVMIPNKLLNEIEKSPLLTTEEKLYIKERYNNEKHFVTDNRFESDNIYKLLCKFGYEKLQITPCLESYNKTKTNKALNKLQLKKIFTDLFIGTSSLVLKCARPYMIDEDKDIVRLSEDAMIMLGVQETDKVIVRYKSTTIKVKAFKIDSIDQIRETNIIGKSSMTDTMIAVPAHLRRKLGIHDINTSLKIERDTGYIFAKNANKQFLPMLALFFTSLKTFNNKIFCFVIFLCALPVVIYIVFSEQRSKIK